MKSAIRQSSIGLVFIFLFSIPGSHWSVAQDQPAKETPHPAVDQDWLTGEGSDLRFRIRGSVVAPDGTPAKAPIVQVVKNGMANGDKTPLDVTMDGSNFMFEVPARGDWWSLNVLARDETEHGMANQNISLRSLRQLAKSGMELTLQPVTRQLRIRIMDGADPVPGANVLAQFDTGYEVTGRSDEQGVALLRCPSGLELIRLTAWLGNQRLNGYSFIQPPRRDPQADEHVIQLPAGRPQRIRVLDEQGQPVPGIKFTLLVATPKPLVNYIGTNEHCTMVTNVEGEAVAEWFPAWDDVHYYAEIRSDDWILARREFPIVDGAIQVVVKPSGKAQRQRISGRVRFADKGTSESLGGFLVVLRSFQGEEENRTEVRRAFTDSDGVFTCDVLPGATYCYYIEDEQWVSAPKHGILFDSTSGDGAEPIIEIERGHLVEIVATQGPDNQAMRGQRVSAYMQYRYSWQGERGTQHGVSGPGWYAETDQDGRATFRTPEGPLEIVAYSPDWQFQESIEVRAGGDNRLHIHRPNAEPQTVRGSIVDSQHARDLSQAQLIVVAMDGQSRDRQVVPVQDGGEFEFETTATTIGAYARSGDGTAAGLVVANAPYETLHVEMQPTGQYLGRIVDKDGSPMAGCKVTARIYVQTPLSGDPAQDLMRSYELNSISAISDEQGEYVLNGVPYNILFSLSVESPDGQRCPLFNRMMEVGENRPVDVYHWQTSPSPQTGFREAWENDLQICRLYDIRLLAAVIGSAEDREWALRLLSGYDECPAILGYLPIRIQASPDGMQPEQQEVMDRYGWALPSANHVVFHVLDGNGDPIAELEVDTTSPDSTKEVYEFLQKHEPAGHNATEELASALQRAKASGRKVWVQHSQNRCAPCFALSRWIDDHRDILEKGFVFVKVDGARDEGGADIVRRITRNRNFGIPFVAILDGDGQLIVDSNGPLGNIGFPSTFDDIRYFRQMIEKSTDRITKDEIDRLVQSLYDQRDQP